MGLWKAPPPRHHEVKVCRGPSANVTRAMQGNYYGGAPYLVPPLQGLRAWVADIRYVRGLPCLHTSPVGLADKSIQQRDEGKTKSRPKCV